MGVIFFLAVVTVIPFGVGPDLALLRRIGPAILWIGALLATLLGLDRLFQADQEDGSLDLIHLSGLPVELVVAAKAAAHWATTGLPLVVAAPLLGLFVNLPLDGLAAVTLTLLVGTPALTFLGAIGAALTVALRRGGLILSILILPLAIPVLIFGVAAADAAMGGINPVGPPLMMLAALTLFSVVVGTIAAAAALRMALD
jgi:heme exporter protein B